ncbi:MAG: glycosyltransferase, partial [Alphaproteobacteria bacterium]
AINLVTSFSSVPLQVASLVGFLFMLLGALIFLYVIANYMIHGGSVPGFTFLASMIAIFSGVQLFSLGIIGEYLSRIHFRSMGQPYGVIRETTDD